ncbi:hypothetical protein G6F42_025416 [Rhizopus arrhizus]|nr:hypothetical protein G6F42_025416 [Rhizopus arrhizus]
MNVTKNQAICMFFYVDYTDENVTNYKKKIDEFEDVEICYNVDERQPILVSKQRIRGDPITYRKYLESIDSSLDQAQSNKRQRNELQTGAQIAQFINEVYRHDEPKNLEIYHKRSMSTKDIYGTIKKYTIVFEKRTSQSFAVWCKNRRLPFLNGKEIRRDGIRLRYLYTMEDAYYDDLIESICNYLPNYQESLRNLIRNGYEIIGYARKSPTIDNIDTRTRLLQAMVDNLHERSFTSKVRLRGSVKLVVLKDLRIID